MLWKIKDSNTYILGSVHLSNTSNLQFSNVVERVFAESTQVIFEADQRLAPDPLLLMSPPGVLLDSLIPKALLRNVREHWLRLGLPEENLLKLRPVVVGITLQVLEAARHSYVVTLGVDTVLRERAEKAGKEIRYLEKINDQFSLLAGIAQNEQISFLSHIANQADAGFSEIVNMISAWHGGDIQYFEGLLDQRRKDWPQMVNDVLTKRNMNWARQIADLAKASEHNLVVVGALHLIGETGLPTLMHQYGLTLVAMP
ncbi:TraB/GumN family protein [Paraburkholderia sp. J67]|uniref:TraB/GumN family protein n=1 Tax=Paraburkholderia sp. J67 TaxID=2805435 RepID=UPI002ABDC554|nr:TraB/GumN family protein [Paraburkholderia sp. J67]